MSTHAKAAAKFLADPERAAWHDRALYQVREKRDRMAHAVPEWETLRQAASDIKLHTLSHLGHYLEEFERNATANGMVVHWASDAREMNRIVLDILHEHGGRMLVKSKSMLAEECSLAPCLADHGIDAVESDLGERIMQLMHRPPSHIVLPAIHVRREEVGELFERELGTERGNSDPAYLTHEARKQLRSKFLTADVAMTGVNFAVASAGAFAVCTNEGNADLGTSFPDLHIAIMVGGKVSNRLGMPKFSKVVVAYIPNEPPRWPSLTNTVRTIVDTYAAHARKYERMGDWIERIGWQDFFKLTGLKFTHHLIDDFRDPAYYTWRQSTQFKF